MPTPLLQNAAFFLISLTLGLGSLAAVDQPLTVELPQVCFSVDVPGKSDQERIFYTANGNSIAVMVYPATDPTWETIRTPGEALRNHPEHPLAAGERLIEKRRLKTQRKDGAWVVKCDDKVGGASPQDAPHAATSWHISRFVYVGDQIIIMQGCWFKNGDIDQDYRTFDRIVDTITLK